MYEVEYKVEITEQEKENLRGVFEQKGFLFKGSTPQNDYYIEAKDSVHGGYDLKRYRKEGAIFIYTEKIWEIVDGSPARREIEHEISQEEFSSVIARFPQAVKITKDREWVAGNYENIPLSVTIDTVKFDHSPNTRYFIEAEIDTENKGKIKKMKDLIIQFLKEVLGKPEITEASGMFAMAFQKK